MSNTIANKVVICEALEDIAQRDRDLVVLCSDSRGSASLTPFFENFPEQSVEVGIAEQNIVSIAAGMAAAGKHPFVASPACFLSTRSYEQVKVDCAYSHTNVKLIGISGGISYGNLGMTHHSLQDVAALSAVPGMRVYVPSDRFQTKALIYALAKDCEPAYVRVGRNAVDDIYEGELKDFSLNKARVLSRGSDLYIIAAGELVARAKAAAEVLRSQGISCGVIDMYCIKPLDRSAVEMAATEASAILTMEEASVFGGLGAQVSQIVAEQGGCLVKNLALPDEVLPAGTSQEVFDACGLAVDDVVHTACELVAKARSWM